MPTYLDASGNPIQSGSKYLDANGNPLSSAPSTPVDHRARLAALKNAKGPGPSGLDATIRDATEGAAHDVVDLGIGAAKGVANTVVGLGALAHKIPGIPGVQQSMAEIAPDQTGAFSGQDPIVNAATTANGTWQKVGKAAEQTAEFFVPGKAEAGALAPVAAGVKRLGLSGRVVTEAANAAGVTAAQGGDPAVAAAVGGAAPLAAAGLGALAPRIVNSLIDAVPKRFRAGANPGEGIVGEGIVAGSLKGLSDRIAATKRVIGKSIGSALTRAPNANATTDVTALIDGPIDRAKVAMATLGHNDAVAALDKMRQGLYDRFAALNSSPAATNAKDLFTIKKILDDGINHAAAEGLPASAKTVARSIRRAFAQKINELVPEVAPLNKRYANLSEAFDSVSDKLNGGNSIANLVSTLKSAGLSSILGGLVGYATHSPLETAAALGAKSVLTSTPVVTAGAQAMRAVGSKTGQVVAGRLAAAGASNLTQPQRTPGDLNALIAALSASDPAAMADRETWRKKIEQAQLTPEEENYILHHIPQ